ncbi:hypothetical protein [Caballeronia sp. BR00000012568055]|uniref:hypothetical protein n=1 Tax=Caballeronia sp. BR00000012568055 TaxID=2918761 RepID=UPI0023F69937|nr:hypothetical protein [Caballeronia sp. BR00000012568055]
MITEFQTDATPVIVREESGMWSVALPHAERPGDLFVTFVNDEEEALWLASQFRPELAVA